MACRRWRFRRTSLTTTLDPSTSPWAARALSSRGTEAPPGSRRSRGRSSTGTSSRPEPRYGGRVTTFDLRRFRLRSGDQARERVDIELAPLLLAGQEYVEPHEHVEETVDPRWAALSRLREE